MKNINMNFCFILVAYFFIFQSSSFSQLNGNYNIGSGEHYSTINSAVNDLVSKGVNAPVIFNIKSGRYFESVTIDSIKGSSLTNIITFQSLTGMADDVSLIANTQSSPVFTLRINRADFLIFRNLTFSGDSVGNDAKTIVELMDNSTDISFINNVFQTNNSYQYSTYLLYSSFSFIRNLNITGNSFIATGNTAYNVNLEGMRLEAKNGSTGMQISNNTFENLSSSITTLNWDSILIEKNTIQMGSNSSINYGINISYCAGLLRVLKNKIVSSYSCNSASSVGYSLLTYFCTNSLIANNFILFKGGSIAVFGIANINQRYFYNTIASLGGQCPFNLAIYNSDLITLKNNIYVNFNTDPLSPGVPYIISSSFIISDNNNFYYQATNIAKYNGQNIPDLETWKTITGEDYSSKTGAVNFISPIDLHLSNSSFNDDNLKGISVQEVTDDIDDNQRDPYFPSMGADEPLYPANISVNLSLSIEGFYDELTNNNVEDTISVYLRNDNSPYAIVDSDKTLLNSDGRVTLRFFNSPTGNYYLVIKHRNSLETWSKTGGVAFTRGAYTEYDFTNSALQAFGSNLTLKGKRYCTYSGDVNQDGSIDLTDILEVYNSSINFLKGYQTSDLNGDLIVDLMDILIAFNNSSKFVHLQRP